MTDERAMIAIERIDQALGRLEEAARAATNGAGAEGNGAGGAGAEELARLRAAHRGLRSQVEGAIAQIDMLLAEEEA